MPKITADNPQVIVFPPALYLVTLMAGLIIQYFFPVHILPLLSAIITGIIAASVAFLIAFSAIGSMRRARTAVNPSLPTTTIVTGGIFKFSRNPIYLAFTLLYLGIALLFNAFWAILFLLPLLFVVQYGIIKREEIYLEHKFGDEYLNYKSNVRRWL